MAESTTLSIYQHKQQSHTVRLLASLYEHTHGSWTLDVVQQPGSAHQNLNRALERCLSRYQVIFDDDVVVLHDGWLPSMLAVLQSNHKVAAVGAWCVRKSLIVPERAAQLPAVQTMPWLPGYVTAIDRVRLGDIRFDEGIPGPSQFSDVDLCWQIRKAGYECALAPVVVYHEAKPVTAERRLWTGPQSEYMARKWGQDPVAELALPVSTELD